MEKKESHKDQKSQVNELWHTMYKYIYRILDASFMGAFNSCW
jgi:hypothetical protein